MYVPLITEIMFKSYTMLHEPPTDTLDYIFIENIYAYRDI